MADLKKEKREKREQWLASLDPKKSWRYFAVTDYEMDLAWWQGHIDSGLITDVICGLEICPKTKKEHWQCVLAFDKDRTKTWSAAKKWSKGRHIEPCDEPVWVNMKYCEKDNNLMLKHHSEKKPGKRTDIDEIKNMVRAGASREEIWNKASNYQAYRIGEIGVSLIAERQKRNWEMDVRWYWGETGTGKTRTALEEFPDAWISGRDLQWWQGYDGHTAVILDDFRGNFCTFHELLRILDRYPYTVAVKGGSRPLLAKTIIVTSSLPPECIYNTKEDVKQLLRRISVVKQFGETAPEVENSNTRGRNILEALRADGTIGTSEGKMFNK